MEKILKQEVLEQLELDINAGFYNEEQLFESIKDMFDQEADLDTDWLRQTIADKYQQHRKESLTWQRPTGFDNLAIAFDELIKERIVCLHNAGYTRQDAEGDCMEVVEKLSGMGIKVVGYCYYHAQDLARAVDPSIKNLLIGFDSATQDDEEALAIANKIVTTLSRLGFQVDWPGTVDKRIEIKNVDWKKVPDEEDWTAARVIDFMTKGNNKKKPFWKFC